MLPTYPCVREHATRSAPSPLAPYVRGGRRFPQPADPTGAGARPEGQEEGQEEQARVVAAILDEILESRENARLAVAKAAAKWAGSHPGRPIQLK